MIACAIITVIFGAVLYQYEIYHERLYFERIEIFLNAVFQQNKEELANEIFAEQKPALANSLNEMQKVRGIAGLIAHDLNGNVLVSTDKKFTAVLSDLERNHLDILPYSIEKIRYDGRAFANYSSIIKVIGEKIGYLKIYFDLAETEKELFLTRVFFFVLLLSILISISVSITMLISRSVIGPTLMLRKAFKKVQKGQLGEQVYINTNDEIGEMATAFNDMSVKLHEQSLSLRNAINDKKSYALKLEETNNKLEKLNISLENIVNKRTSELTKSNKRLQQEIDERKHAEKEKRGLEEKLVRSQKMEALGLLAGGVAHDLNNVLTGIVSYPDFLLMNLAEDNPLRKPMLTIRDSGQKAADIVQDLLTLARRGVVNTKVLNLNTIISNYLKSPECKELKHHLPGIHIETNLEANLLNIRGSSIHLEKTVMNLISNAAEAQPDGGKIIIFTGNQYRYKPIKGYDDIVEGEFVVLKVSDKGTGIAHDDLKRIFEPFYTKKVMGRSGTGLGMAVVWGTVQDHHGYINIDTVEGKGTTFKLYFPATRKKAVKAKSSIPVENYMGNGESILVVDDIRQQREIASGLLKEFGYSVATVPSGEQAIKYMQNNTADILLLDMIMEPGIDGLDTYKQIIKLNPDQKAIIASGFAESDRVKEAQALGVGEYVKKPYTLEKIGVAIKAELKK